MEFDDVIVKENPGLCRCCLSEGCYKELATEYLWMGENEVYADMLLECFDISISQNNEGPNGTNRLICEVCITRLRDACNFKKQVLECEKKFVDMVGRGDFKQRVTVDILFEDNLKLEQNTEEQLQDTGNFDFLEEPMAFDDEINDDVTAEPLPVKGKRGRPKKSIKSVKKKEEKPKASKAKDATDPRRPHLLTLINNTSVIPFKGQNSCLFCDKTLEYDELNKHIKSHGPNVIMNTNIPDEVKVDVSVTVCEKCNIVFENFDNLRQHLLDEHAFVDFNLKPVKLTLSCDNCKKVFTSKLGLKYHLSRCKDSSNRTKVIKQNIAILLNMSTALPFKYFMNRFRCFHCSKDFVQFDSLKEHSVKQHTHCDLKSKSMKFLKGRDISLKIDISNLSCKVCSEKYSDVSALIDHLIVNHKAAYDTTVEYLQSFKIAKDSIPCPFCSDVFQYFRKLLEHINLLHSVENFVCAYCGQTFGNNYNYRAHISRYHRQESVKCIECSTEFATVHKLSRHKARVHGEKIYQCQQCDDKFGTQYLLKKHAIQVHSSGHKCMYCSRIFTINSHLRNHVRRLHLKEKNFECNICSERFFDKPLLKTHLVKHIGERNYHCDICGKRFLWKKNLRGHMSSHGQMN
ncbi:zinc finger protein 62 isoform X4 [Pieris rapae]|uniref:zinc finger protein 62 isoform X4 n=1 Tax=Pieris rapae TaxID=64459 RepID=UPI001E28035B|nr:zinc finger protein 62 isoform X4 [Pieris rapae]